MTKRRQLQGAPTPKLVKGEPKLRVVQVVDAARRAQLDPYVRQVNEMAARTRNLAQQVDVMLAMIEPAFIALGMVYNIETGEISVAEEATG